MWYPLFIANFEAETASKLVAQGKAPMLEYLTQHGQGGKDGQNNQNNAKTLLLVTFPQEKLKPKTKNHFFDFDCKTCCIRKGFEQLCSSIAWRVMGLQSSAIKVAHAGLKGSNLQVSAFK